MSPGRRGKRRSHTLHTRPAWWARQDSNLQPDRYERPEPMLGHASQRMLMNKYEHNFKHLSNNRVHGLRGLPMAVH